MVRGKRLFKCDECHHTFMALDMEYAATVYSAPVRCPYCGSMHTYPAGAFFSKSVYKEIWKSMDENNAPKE